ncbi:hypothetical protein D5018_20845 [Parashewanella curva]|uniref:Uncharacterized protein n=1 Tax=Parashewanella curva TaxID=2338552 RepID=A0A3L8PUP3_9GAMM|nr:hypothetical protein [Parashewanella curva]RLV57762.1 hypothetical protein D5018_20845 [Parashewanella curva]
MDVQKYSHKINRFKSGGASLIGGVLFLIFAVYMLENGLVSTRILSRLLDKYPDLFGFLEWLNLVFWDILFIFSVVLIDFGVRFLLFKKHKNLEAYVGKDRIVVPNVLTGGNYIIPSYALESVTEKEQSIVLSFHTEDGLKTRDFSKMFFPKPDEFKSALDSVLDNKKQNQSEINEQDLYTVAFKRNEKNQVDLDRKLTILSKLLKSSKDRILTLYSKGEVLIRKHLSLEQAKKLQSATSKYKLELDIISEKEKKLPLQPPMGVILPTLSCVVAATIIPGGYVFWFLAIYYLLAKSNKKFKFDPILGFVALLIEIQAQYIPEATSFDISDFLISASFLATSIYLSLGMKRDIEKISDKPLSTIKTIFFGMIYINYKTNQLLVNNEVGSK